MTTLGSRTFLMVLLGILGIGCDPGEDGPFGATDTTTDTTDTDSEGLRDSQAATATFAASVKDGELASHKGFAKAAALDEQVCEDAQALVAAFETGFYDSDITVTSHSTMQEFGAAQPEVIVSPDARVTVHAFQHQGANPTRRFGSPVHTAEVWCKLKNQDSLAEALSLTVTEAEGTCADVNALVLDQALSLATLDEREAFLALGPTVSFEADMSFASGLEWLELSQVEIGESAPGTIAVLSPRLRTSMTEDEPIRGVLYCKVWSLARALRLVLEWR